MPRIAPELSALEVRNLSHPSGKGNVLFSVGGVTGLYLQITPGGGRSWILRMTVGKARRDIGLGGFPTVTLAQARDKAREARDKIERGIDPVTERQAAKAALIAAAGRGLTFATAMDRYLAAKLDAFKNAKHRQQWQNTLAQYALPVLGKMMVQDIDVQDVLRVLQPMRAEKTETASRLRGRIESVLSWATVAGHRKGDNPARWAGNLKELLPAPSKIAKEGNQPALTLKDAPRWFAALKARDGTGARALEFLALTAARSQEVRGAAWDEFDLDKALWTVAGVDGTAQAADWLGFGRFSHRLNPEPAPWARPKNFQPFRLVPVIARAAADSDLNRRPSHSKPSARTVTECSIPSQSRTSRVPGIGRRGSATIGPGAPLATSPASASSVRRASRLSPPRASSCKR